MVWHDAATLHRPLRASESQRFVMVFTDGTSGERIILGTTSNPDEATVAFHHQLALLRARSVVGELVVLRQDPEEMLVLRQPIGRQITPTLLTTLSATRADGMAQLSDGADDATEVGERG